MSVIWSGITEGGAIVPVQVDESGKVIATADPRPELWTKTGQVLTPSSPSDSIQTSGDLVLNSASGTSTLQAADSSGVKIYSLPATSGTLALESSEPPPPSGITPHASGFWTSSGIDSATGIRSLEEINPGILSCLYEKDLKYLSPVWSISPDNSAGPPAMYWYMTPYGTGATRITWKNIDRTSVTAAPFFAFVVWDLGAISPNAKKIHHSPSVTPSPVPESDIS